MSTRKKTSVWLATTTAALLAFSGLALAPANAVEPVATPQIELSKQLLDSAGDTLTVTGTGFDASFAGLASYYGCSDPANAPKGFYVQLGWITDAWKPSTGGASGVARSKGTPNTWFADKDKNCVAPSKWTIEADGTASFSYTFENITPAALKGDTEKPAGARYAVFTNGAGGGTQAVNELSQNVYFAPGTATTEVTKADATGLTVAVDATGLPADVTAGYGALIEKGTEGSLTDPSSPTAAVAQIEIADGSSSFQLVAPKAKLDAAKQYSVVIWKHHAVASPENIYALADVDITPAQWGEVFSPTTSALKFASSSVAYNSATSATVTVSSEAGTPTGKATLKVAGQSSVVDLVGGKATVKLSKLLTVGSYPATVTYANTGSGTLFGASTATATVKVTKATPKVSAKLAKKSVSAKKNGKLNVAVSIPGSLGAKASKYKVQVFDGKKKLKTVALNSSGKASVKLPKLKRGTHKLKVVVLATANTNAKSSSVAKLKVTR